MLDPSKNKTLGLINQNRHFLFQKKIVSNDKTVKKYIYKLNITKFQMIVVYQYLCQLLPYLDLFAIFEKKMSETQSLRISIYCFLKHFIHRIIFYLNLNTFVFPIPP